MVGLMEHGVGAFAPAPGDELGVPPGNRRDQVEPGAMGAAAEEEGRPKRPRAMARVYAALCRAADAGEACPSNRALCAAADIPREAWARRLLRALGERGMITVEWTAPSGGARRVAIHANGRRTGWSERGARWAGDAAPLPGAGMRELARALGQSGERFADVTAAEARRIARDTPPDTRLPSPPAPHSYVGCALSRLVRREPDEGEGEAIAAGQ